MKKIIFLELNEVPEKIFVKSLKDNKKIKLENFVYNATISNDKGHLSPWTTWATIHRGVTDNEHGIIDINQDTSKIDKKFPTLTSELIERGMKVGLFGSLHSGSISSKEFSKYKFLIPEVFANYSKCKPKSLIPLQNLNLYMTRASARNVTRTFPPILILIKGILSYLRHVNDYKVLFRILLHLLMELCRPWTKVRRRTIQSLLMFDVFMNLIKKNNCDFSVFFTNHVAANMHRFWEASFPEDYLNKVSNPEWTNKYKNEIGNSMEITNYFISKLIEYIDSNRDFELWIASSMGQAAVQDYKKELSYWHIEDMNTFLSSLCNEKVIVKELPQMIPHYGFQSDYETIKKIVHVIKNIQTNAQLNIRSKTLTTLTFNFDTANIKKLIFTNKLDNKSINLKGLKNITIDEETGSSAYHIPKGILYRYGNDIEKIDNKYLDSNGFLPTNKIREIIINKFTEK